MPEPKTKHKSNAHREMLDNDSQWYKRAIIYELHVRAFHDSDGNGIGDFKGLTEKLDYLRDLGITAIWLLPFYPSPLKDDGYDIADYYSIHENYGVLSDFKTFLKEAHARGLRVITELVLNHTSDQHPWFRNSRTAKPGSRRRDYYIWSDTAEEYKDARIIFKDFEASNWTWDPLSKSYYWHRFYAHQPDLNYDNPGVHREMIKVVDFWFDLGVDGLRLDAVPYLYKREGTSCENLPETHQFLKKLRRHIDAKYGDRMLLAEANQWPEDAVTYLGEDGGDECHMAFHFPLMPRLFMSLRMEDRVPIIDILEQTPPIPDTAQWALFLRNHDELTLEMVTDEERDYMYRMYAHDQRARINLGIRRRLAPLLGNDRKKIELMNALLFSMPGTPVVYYGDEIGMGENIYLGDRNGVRTPMQWSSDRNAGFSNANPQSLYLPIILDPEYHYEACNVEAQQRNPHSILWWMKRLLALRKRYRAFGEGSIEFLHPENRKILAFIRRLGDEIILVVANLSRFAEPVELDLSDFNQMVPIELFSRNEFPPIEERPFFLTLSPHAFFWFSLEPRFKGRKELVSITSGQEGTQYLEMPAEWKQLLSTEKFKSKLEDILQVYIRSCRWFGSKTRIIKNVAIEDYFVVHNEDAPFFITILAVDYIKGDQERYLLPIGYSEGEDAEHIASELPHTVIAHLRKSESDENALVYDATASKTFNSKLFDLISKRRVFKGVAGKLHTTHTALLRKAKAQNEDDLEPTHGKAEQTNTSIIYGDSIIMKLFRKLETGTNPDIEIGRFLTEKRFQFSPRFAGALEYRKPEEESTSVALLNEFIPESRDAWQLTLEILSRYYERILSTPPEFLDSKLPEEESSKWFNAEIPSRVSEIVGSFLETAYLLGERTGALHEALSYNISNKDFAPEPFTPHYQRSLYQSIRNLAKQNFQQLKSQYKYLNEHNRALAEEIISQENRIEAGLRMIFKTPMSAMRTRCHGDFHLGQVLHTGKDFLIIDFEGEPARTISERRIKHSPLSDVAGMVRSFHYAAFFALQREADRGALDPEQAKSLERWAQFWYKWVTVEYIKSYLHYTKNLKVIPNNDNHFNLLFEAFLLKKAVYELGYELNNRPDWVGIPIHGILELFTHIK